MEGRKKRLGPTSSRRFPSFLLRRPKRQESPPLTLRVRMEGEEKVGPATAPSLPSSRQERVKGEKEMYKKGWSQVGLVWLA